MTAYRDRLHAGHYEDKPGFTVELLGVGNHPTPKGKTPDAAWHGRPNPAMGEQARPKPKRTPKAKRATP